MNNFGGMGMGTGLNNSGINNFGMNPGMNAMNNSGMNFPQMGNVGLMNQRNNLNQMNQSGMNQSGMMQANLANIAQLEQQRILEEEERNKKEKEEIEKDLNEQIEKILQDKRENQFIRPINTLVVQPELFFERDRFFFEELLMEPMMTEGLLGMDHVRIDKRKILGDKGEITHEFNKDYFDKMKYDGCYIDIVKKQINSYNLEKVEQRSLREVFILFK